MSIWTYIYGPLREWRLQSALAAGGSEGEKVSSEFSSGVNVHSGKPSPSFANCN